MRYRARSARRGSQRLLTLVAIALFGLMSMHGWGTHSSGHGGAHSGADQRSLLAATTPTAHDHASADHAPATSSASVIHAVVAGGGADLSATADDCDGECSDAGAGLSLWSVCLAVLGLLALGLALLLLRRGVRDLRLSLPAWRPLELIGRDRDPPDLLRLCVIRC